MAHRLAPRLLASDLDGTLIPPDASEQRLGEVRNFRRVVEAMGLTLAYVTGRHLSLALEGVARFDLPLPEALACDVGTTLYWRRDGAYVADPEYRDALAALPGVVDGRVIRDALEDLPWLRAQESEKQSSFKVSYYLDHGAPPTLAERVRERLAEVGSVRLVESHDPVTGARLLDILPAEVGKASAVRHIARGLGLHPDEVVFAGDSGNDRDAFLSGVRAVVVGNAPEELRSQLHGQVEDKGLTGRVYFATSHFAAGVIQGLQHFNSGL